MLTISFIQNKIVVGNGNIEFDDPLPRLKNAEAWEDFLSTPLPGTQFKNIHDAIKHMAKHAAAKLYEKDQQLNRALDAHVETEHGDNCAFTLNVTMRPAPQQVN